MTKNMKSFLIPFMLVDWRNKPNRIPQPLPSDDFQEVIRQLRKIGNNLNQITVIAHKTGSIDIMKFKQAVSNLNDAIIEIREQVYLPKEVS